MWVWVFQLSKSHQIQVGFNWTQGQHMSLIPMFTWRSIFKSKFLDFISQKLRKVGVKTINEKFYTTIATNLII